MKWLARLATAAVLVWLVVPEIPRYRAERAIGVATAMFGTLAPRADQPEAARDLLRVGALALSAAPGLPGDPRPALIAGSAFLVTGQAEPALQSYRDAFATGERAEIDLNLGRAYVLARRPDSGEAALLRAGWISPEILSSLSPSVREVLLRRIGGLTRELHAGRLTAPPPVPSDERR